MKLILLGAPGAGKGSQATKIASKYGIAHISTGDALRAQIAKGTELGRTAKIIMEQGGLVPDDVVVGIVASRIGEPDCGKGFLLDGFPRTVTQADALSKLTEIDYVININVNPDLIMNRICGRRMCACGESYHISTYTVTACKKCGGTLYQRADDNEATVLNRLAAYDKQTKPLVDYYRAAGKLVDMDGNRSIEQLFEDIQALLDGNG